jgi:tight adherence protein B
LSGVEWFDEMLKKLNYSENLRLLLYQADLKWTVGKLLLSAVGAAIVAGYLVYLRSGAVVLAVPIAILAGAAPFFYVLQKRARRFDKMRQYLPEALDMMVAAIRAGHTFGSAIGMASKDSPEPVRSEFRQCFDEQNFGLELRFALQNLAHRVPIHEIRIIVTALLIQSETGGNLTEILDKVAYLIREDFKLQRQVKVHTAQGRMTGWILSLLPPALGVLLYLANPQHMSLLWERPIGRQLMAASIVMTTIGALIIRRIVRIRI